MSFVKKTDSCWLWIGHKNEYGYGVMHLKNRGCQLSHRISYEVYKGEIEGKLCVCHTCDNPACVNPAHLWLGTHKDNIRDSVKKGRFNQRILSRSSERTDF